MNVSVIFESYSESSSDAIRVERLGEEAVTNGQKDEPQVLPEGARSKVSEIQAEFFREHGFAIENVGVGGGAQDLFFVAIDQCRQVGNSRTHRQDCLPGRSAGLDVFRRLRTGPHQAHVALKHIEKLRQLVELEFPQHGPGSRDARVSRSGDRAPTAAGAHRSKFPNAERLAVLSHSGLAEQHRWTV